MYRTVPISLHRPSQSLLIPFKLHNKYYSRVMPQRARKAEKKVPLGKVAEAETVQKKTFVFRLIIAKIVNTFGKVSAAEISRKRASNLCNGSRQKPYVLQSFCDRKSSQKPLSNSLPFSFKSKNPFDLPFQKGEKETSREPFWTRHQIFNTKVDSWDLKPTEMIFMVWHSTANPSYVPCILLSGNMSCLNSFEHMLLLYLNTY